MARGSERRAAISAREARVLRLRRLLDLAGEHHGALALVDEMEEAAVAEERAHDEGDEGDDRRRASPPSGAGRRRPASSRPAAHFGRHRTHDQEVLYTPAKHGSLGARGHGHAELRAGAPELGLLVAPEERRPAPRSPSAAACRPRPEVAVARDQRARLRAASAASRYENEPAPAAAGGEHVVGAVAPPLGVAGASRLAALPVADEAASPASCVAQAEEGGDQRPLLGQPSPGRASGSRPR